MEENGIAIPFDIDAIHESIFKRLARKICSTVRDTVVRIIEIIVSLVGIVLLIPLAIVTFFQNLKNGENGPVFYSQYRIGKSGKLFKMYKLRTMVTNADEILEAMLQDKEVAKEYHKYRKFKNDPRLTKFGKVLRAKSLDEFPQFINVLLGEMSLVRAKAIFTRRGRKNGRLL